MTRPDWRDLSSGLSRESVFSFVRYFYIGLLGWIGEGVSFSPFCWNVSS